ncbi:MULTISPECIES: porin [Comamonas]|uniref:porin n=1 Tax=Comamonas TaxID=283 RepID=UPI000557509C|nr:MULTISPECIES: porin [Comamonas]TFF62901.1 porin [Comamonas sp. A23]
MRNTIFAVLGLTSAFVTHAQSNVTVFGSLDLNVTYAKAGSRHVTGMDQGGYMLPSRIGFRGTEDLGGGLSAGFWLEAAVLPDTGTTQSAFFGRRSTVSLTSQQFGEIRLGRDYTPAFWNISQFSPFGTVGVGGSSNLIDGWPLGSNGAKTLSRASNSIGYFLPKMQLGIYGQLSYAAGENVDGAKYLGGRIGYASGPLNIAAAYGQTKMTAGDYKTVTLGGTYDFGVVKAYANYFQQKLNSYKQTNVLIGAALPVSSVGTVKASVAQSKVSGTDDKANQIAVGYTHQLSKRTTLYTAYSHISNKGNSAYVTADVSPEGASGQNSQGVQFGINHAF